MVGQGAHSYVAYYATKSVKINYIYTCTKFPILTILQIVTLDDQGNAATIMYYTWIVLHKTGISSMVLLKDNVANARNIFVI